MYVSAVDRLSGMEGMRWLPAVVVSRKSTEVVVRLLNGHVLRRHVDCVRKRESGATEVSDDFVELPPPCVVSADSAAAEPAEVPNSGNRSDRPLLRSGDQRERRAPIHCKTSLAPYQC